MVDEMCIRDRVEAAYKHVGPVYLRFGRAAVPVINDNADYKFEIGKAVTLRAVSYTHLDVYKRQIMSNAFNFDI